MSRPWATVPVRWILIGFVASLAVGVAAWADEPKEKDALKKATADGKYYPGIQVAH